VYDWITQRTDVLRPGQSVGSTSLDTPCPGTSFIWIRPSLLGFPTSHNSHWEVVFKRGQFLEILTKLKEGQSGGKGERERC